MLQRVTSKSYEGMINNAVFYGVQYHYVRCPVPFIVVLTKFLQILLYTHEFHHNYSPKNGGHFERKAAIGRRNTPLNSYVAVSRTQ